MIKRSTHSKELFQHIKVSSDVTPPIVVGYNIKTPENIGNIIRLADNFGCGKVLFTSTETNKRSTKIKKTAASSYNSVKWSFCREGELEEKIPSDFKWIAIETASDSKNIYEFKMPGKVALIVGNEISGIASELLDKCQHIVHIPLPGEKNSMNVSHALAIALSEWQKQNINF